MTSTTIQKSHPLFAPRPTSRPPLEAPEPQESFTRSEPSPLSFGLKAFSLGAVALSVMGAASAQEQTQTEVRPVHRHSPPLSGPQRDSLNALAEARDTDSEGARDVRTNFRHQVDRLQKEAIAYEDASEILEGEGRRLETAADLQGPGRHGNLTVERNEKGVTITEVDGKTITEVRRYGDTMTVEVSNGRTRQTLEDTPDARRVTDGMNSRTLHLKDGLLHKAGDFESEQVTRSWSDSLVVNGTTVTRNLERMVYDGPGRARVNESETFSVPVAAPFADAPTPSLAYHQSTTRKVISTGEVTQTHQDVDLP